MKSDFRKKGMNPRVVKFGVPMSLRTSMIFELLVDGLSNAEIGKRLGIDEKGVKFHVTKIYQEKKIVSAGVNTRGKLILFALGAGVRR